MKEKKFKQQIENVKKQIRKFKGFLYEDRNGIWAREQNTE